ncbi:protein phosphatase 2C domain-containing protein [Actinoplanes sp. NPDC051861]|uniref:PP2C family protein-serine/threonine phosphatase n=1 Tax=Actinoplanes sp. NPDC051861 TaxID=3155170 RepID=UPI0034435C06
MILTDCTACADERAAGAAFCEVCGRELAPPEANGADATVPLPAANGADTTAPLPAANGADTTAPLPAANGADTTAPLPAADATVVLPPAGPPAAPAVDAEGAEVTAVLPEPEEAVELPSPGDPPAAGEPVAGSTAAAPKPEKSAKDWMDCPHCGTHQAVGPDGYCEECGMLAGRPRDHLEADGGAAGAAVSDRGRRHHRNEDAMWLAVGEAAADVVVCDGVSASYDPDAASEIAARTAGEMLAVAQHPGSGEPEAAEESADVTTDLSTADETDSDSTTVIDPDATTVVPRASGVPEKSETDEPGPAIAVAGVVAAAVAAAAEAVASLAHTGDPRRSASNPACTIVAAAVRGPHVGFGWVGDSRAYWLGPEGPAEQLTEDDSWAQHVIALGVDPETAMNDPKAHAITAWLGADAGPVRPRVGAFTVTQPGLLVLCSDGLWNYLTDPGAFADVVRACLVSASGPSALLDAARSLVAYANKAGGADNITVALVPVHP